MSHIEMRRLTGATPMGFSLWRFMSQEIDERRHRSWERAAFKDEIDRIAAMVGVRQ
jgi:hypothetical protein